MREDPEQIAYFAATNSRGKRIPFGIKRKDRARHVYVVGKTGMGKSTMLENMAIQDIRNGEGIAFIDPHGSTADRILEYVPEHRIKDVLYFAPFDMDYPIAFNIMEDVGYDKRHLVVSGLLSAFRKIWVDAWSARMEYILSNTLLALLEYPGSTLLDVNRMLVNKEYRKKVVEHAKDPIVKSFWLDEFATYTDRYTQEATPAIQNKIGQFTSNPLIRNIVGQPKSSFDFREMMDSRKIIIMNLSKGRVGEVNAQLLGSMLVTKIYLAAMSRADASSSELAKLPNFYFFVDEFQSFANQSFSDILSEARKYKLNLIIAHQYIEQMEEEVRSAVFGNVGSTIVFRVGPFDAEILETVFKPHFVPEDLLNLGFAQIYLTLMIDGVGSAPFSATTLPPFDLPPTTYAEQVKDFSRQTYAAQRQSVEAEIKRIQEETPMQQRPKPAEERSAYYRTQAGFPPRGSAPVRSAPPAPSGVGGNPGGASRGGQPFPATPRGERPMPLRFPQQPREERPRPPQPQTQPPRERPRPPQPSQPEAKKKPPLEGGTSLREAIERAKRTVAAERKSIEEKKGQELQGVLAKAGVEGVPRQEEPANVPHDKPKEVPEEVLRQMLKLDDSS